MSRHHEDVNGGESAMVALDQYDSVREHLHGRLCEEVQELETRINTLRASPSAHSTSIIRTYERMIRKKRAFMSQWGMDDSCSRAPGSVRME